MNYQINEDQWTQDDVRQFRTDIDFGKDEKLEERLRVAREELEKRGKWCLRRK